MMTNAEHIDIEINDKVKGVIWLLYCLELAYHGGEHKYQKKAYYALSLVLKDVLKNSKEIQQKIDYMHNKLRDNKLNF